MLVLSRRIGESIVIGGGVEVRVLKAGAERVRLGISAPSDLTILRAELPRRIQQGPLVVRARGKEPIPRETAGQE